MKQVKSIVSVIGVIIKYSAVIIAVIKGIEVVHTELQKIDFNDKSESDANS